MKGGFEAATRIYIYIPLFTVVLKFFLI